ncbi:MAG: iron-sulfur cluster assembly protein [Planctomycetota bacterium]|nr:iron-sulfur cluster assembly protein [Planctomycetota bacterium]
MGETATGDAKAPQTTDEKIKAALRRVFDPEIPVNIYDLGLIYKIEHDPAKRRVVVTMTLTSPHCPEAETIPETIKRELELVAEIDSALVLVVWDPPWEKGMMSEDAKLALGME